MSEHEVNLGKAQTYLKKFGDKVTGHYINGRFDTPAHAETFQNLSPVDNSSLGEVVSGTEEDMDRACEAARVAFAGWRDMPGAARKKLLNQFADNIAARAEEIALIESMDCGLQIQIYP